MQAVKHSRFQRHIRVLIWKCYLQRRRRWGLLLVETIFAITLFVIAVYVAWPVFLKPLETEPEAPLNMADLLASGHRNNILGFAPNTVDKFKTVMNRAAQILNADRVINGTTEDDLNQQLYNLSMGKAIKHPVTWVIWKEKEGNVWRFEIKSTERARYGYHQSNSKLEASIRMPNPHLRAGFLAIQVAVSKAILEQASTVTPDYELSLVSMPVSPLMQEHKVRRAITGILLCLTLALLPPVLETQAIVVTESYCQFKRALRMRHVDYAAMYFGWISYGFLTAMPICMLAAITLILIFRWVHLLFVLCIIFVYITVMIMLALIMAMFHTKASIACIWSILFTLLQTFLAELMLSYQFIYQLNQKSVEFLLHIIIPPIGLVDSLNQLTKLQTGSQHEAGKISIFLLGTWAILISFYFGLLMLLHRTVGQAAIGGAVSWKSIIFKKPEKKDALHRIETPTGKERDMLQEVDELVAKAISMQNVSKSIMSVPVLSNVTLDIYRGEFTLVFAERVQDRIITTLEDLLTGLTFADKGEIVVMGKKMQPGSNYMTERQMMGYCHRCIMLIDDLTVQEHLTLFFEISLWNESNEDISKYSHIRSMILIRECDLMEVKNVQVWRLDQYYRAQLCWAIAILLEPRVVLLSRHMDNSTYKAVINDKVVRYKKSLTLIKMSCSTLHIEYGDRVFLFDGELLVFGGTPAYMFFTYGREYRIRLTLEKEVFLTNTSTTDELIRRAALSGATITAHLGSLLIMMIPTSPTENVAALVQDLTDNANKYGITSMSISLPDSEEVFRRAIAKTRASVYIMLSPRRQNAAKEALIRLAAPPEWKRKVTTFGNWTLLKNIGWKYFSFFYRYRLFLIITIIAAITTGLLLAISFSYVIDMFEETRFNTAINGEYITVEALEKKTILMLRSDQSPEAVNIANAYVLSNTNATVKQTQGIAYTVLPKEESMTEYLATRAIDSPQQYVNLYAYGIDVYKENNTINVQAFYSPLHYDTGAAARSLARAYMALIRFYTGAMDASIEVIDNPLALDLTPLMNDVASPPLITQLLLIITTCHITLLPSLENGLIRHMQSHTMNFTPARYWLTLYLWDIFVYSMLVGLTTGSMITFMNLYKPYERFYVQELAVIPIMMSVYGLGCIPLAYLFSLGPRAALNFMSFVIVNIVLGEATILNKVFTDKLMSYAMFFFGLSPQANMSNALAKIKETFLYNSECFIFNKKNLCSSKTLHRCCKKCGLLQECFARRFYLSTNGILIEEIASIGSAIAFTMILLLWEYRYIQRAWRIMTTWYEKKSLEYLPESMGAKREMINVLDKANEIREKRVTYNKFGEGLLAVNLSRKDRDERDYSVNNVYLGLGQGQILALSGIKRHGRKNLCEVISGYTMPTDGDIWCKSKWKLTSNPQMFSSQVTLCCDKEPLPPWMSARDGLEFMAILRGVPLKHAKAEVQKLIDALELQGQADMLVSKVKLSDRTRIHFAAAVLGAPPILVMDECTAYQKYSVRRAMYYILHHLKLRGHSIFMSSSSVESHLPLTSRIAILKEGRIYDIDELDVLIERYSKQGFTVVVHLKDHVDVNALFSKYFKTFTINDTTEVLVNVQIVDKNLTYAQVFQRMETLQAQNHKVYSYIVTSIPLDSVYNYIIDNETPKQSTPDFYLTKYRKFFGLSEAFYVPKEETLNRLLKKEKMYDITKLAQLPWSVIFQQ